MYRRNIAAAAAVLFLSSAVGISDYAAPQKDNSATEAETETETFISEGYFIRRNR